MRVVAAAARASPLLAAGGALVTVVVVVAVIAPFVSPYEPRALAGDALQPPSARHLLGTNNLGQDIVSQLLWGARESLVVAFAGAGLAVIVAVLLGVAPALLGGGAQLVAARLTDMLLAVPGLPLVLLIATLADPNRAVLVVVVAIAGAPMMARVFAAQTMTLRQRGFVASAKGMGAAPRYVVRRHLVPGLAPVIVARFVDWAGVAVLLQAGLAFLGLSDPTQVSWGLMLNQATAQPGLYFTPVWVWWVVPAGVAVSITILGFTLVGVGLEDRLKPQRSRS